MGQAGRLKREGREGHENHVGAGIRAVRGEGTRRGMEARSTNLAQAASQVIGTASPFGVIRTWWSWASRSWSHGVRPWRPRPLAAGRRRPDVPALQHLRARDPGLDHERARAAPPLCRRPRTSSHELSTSPRQRRWRCDGNERPDPPRHTRTRPASIRFEPSAFGLFRSQPATEHVGARVEIVYHDVLVDPVRPAHPRPNRPSYAGAAKAPRLSRNSCRYRAPRARGAAIGATLPSAHVASRPSACREQSVTSARNAVSDLPS